MHVAEQGAGGRLRRRSGPLLLLFLLVSSLFFQPNVAVHSSRDVTDAPAFHVVSEEAQVLLTWTAPPVKILTANDGTAVVAAGGYETLHRPGWPRVPFTSTLIALPPHATPHLQVLADKTTLQPLLTSLALAPRPSGVQRDKQGRPVGGTFAPVETPSPISEERPTAAQPVLLEEVGTVRGVRLARVTFFPAWPREGQLQVTRHLRVAVAWTPVEGDRTATAPTDDALLAGLRVAVVNPRHVVPSSSAAEPGPNLRPQGGALEAFLEVTDAGLYRVTHEDLAPLSLTAADPHDLRLFRGADEVAYRWEGDDDAIFGPGEAVLFYAEPRFSRWTERDVYRLTAGAGPGLRMTTRSGDPQGLPLETPLVTRLFEENRLYTPDRFAGALPAGRDGDRWVWDYLHPGQPRATYAFSLDDMELTAGSELTLWLLGYTKGSHRWEVTVNGSAVGSVTWTGQTAVTETLTLPAGALRRGENALTLTVPEVEGGWLDAFAVRYARSQAAVGESVRFGEAAAPPEEPAAVPGPYRVYLPLALRRSDRNTGRASTVRLAAAGPYHAYDVTDPLRPQRLTTAQIDGQTVTVGGSPSAGSRRYLITAERAIRRPERIRPREDPGGVHVSGGAAGADLLIITHPDFAAGLDPLVALRRDQGLAVTVINVLGLYDTYGDGRPDPEAIRAFIAAAYAGWDPCPTYVLLVGAGTYDPRQYRPTSPPTYLPPYLAEVDPWAGETAADNRYVAVDGDDALPDLLVGRLPVRSAEETQVVVEKIVSYERDPLPGGWNADVVLVADDADGAGDFAAFSDAVASYVDAPFHVTRRYCADASPSQSDCAPADRDALHAALLADWRAGALLMQFAGHASWQQWAAERFFHLDDLVELRNGPRLPLVMEMTCFTGAFHRPEPTLDAALLLKTDGGAAAVWGPSGLGVGTGHMHLARGFARALFVDEAAVGEAALAGKLRLAAAGQHLDLLDTFNLLGDPALRPTREIVPWRHHTYLPLVSTTPEP